VPCGDVDHDGGFRVVEGFVGIATGHHDLVAQKRTAMASLLFNQFRPRTSVPNFSWEPVVDADALLGDVVADCDEAGGVER